MYLKLQSGRYAGEMRDVRVDQARLMLADGRAVRPETVLAHAVVPAHAVESAVMPKPSRKARRG